MTNHEFMRKAEAKAKQCWTKLEKKYNRTALFPSISYDLRGRVAGQASSRGFMRFNLGFIAKNGDDMLNQTVPHEVVHAFLYAIKDPSHVRDFETIRNDAYMRVAGFGRRRTKRQPHGHTFMSLLSFLGCQEKRTHNYDTSEAGGHRRWAYKCPGCGKDFALSTTIHNKVRRGQRRWCTRCGAERGVLVRA